MFCFSICGVSPWEDETIARGQVMMDGTLGRFGDRRRERGGAFLPARRVAVGSRGVRVRRLGGARAGEIRITRGLRNPAVSVEERIETAAGSDPEVGCRAPCAGDPGHDDGSRRRQRPLHRVASGDRGRCDRGGPFGTGECALLLAHRRQGGAVQRQGLRRKGESARARRCRTRRRLDVRGERRHRRRRSRRRHLRGFRLEAGGRRGFDPRRPGPCPHRGIAPVRARREPSRSRAHDHRAAGGPRLALRHLEIARPVSRKGHPELKALPPSGTLTLVEAAEVDPPEGVPIAPWRLLTTHTVAAAARRIVAFSRRRWLIEELFRTLKTKGFAVEALRLAEGGPFEKLVAASLIAAVTVLQLVRERDGAAKRPIEDAFDPDDRPALEAVGASLEGRTVRQNNPHPPGSLAFAAWVLARLGGWTGDYGKPGPVVMLHGLVQFHAIKHGWTLKNV
ncbi:MAG TPA: transposase [Alphaproteobacteria bacterium]|nr:transposase [Alphaproteobacteria bacterium]